MGNIKLTIHSEVEMEWWRKQKGPTYYFLNLRTVYYWKIMNFIFENEHECGCPHA